MTTVRRHPALEQFYAFRRLWPSLGFTADGAQVYFSSNASGQFNLWCVPAGSGCADQLTAFEEESVRGDPWVPPGAGLAVSHRGRAVVFTADHQGNEFGQLYSLPPDHGWPEQLTDAPSVQHHVNATSFSPDGSLLAYSSNARVQEDMELWVREQASGEAQLVFGEGRFVMPAGWAPDNRRLLAMEIRLGSDSSIHLVDVGTGEAEELTPHDDEARFVPGPWAADGSGFHLLSDQGREYLGLGFYRLAERRTEWLETPDWEIEELAGSPDGTVLAWIVNEDGYGRLRLRDLASGRELPSPELPHGCVPPLGSGLCFSPDGRYMALLWAEAQRPVELYAVEVATGAARRLTQSMLGGVGPEEMVEPELIRYPTFDAREIPAWLFRPRRGGRAPVVLAIHGGPEAQERPWYTPLYQYLVSRGIGVLATNIRGSTGYGKSYQRLVLRDWGGGDLRDWEHAVRWLRAQDWVDGERLGVFGGSYGGFATLTCVTRLPDEWAAAVDIVGPSNLVTFAKAVPPSWRRFMSRSVGDPDEEADFLTERSPITYVDRVRAPLLVLQGANDPRVVKGESDQMVERLRELGRQVEYVVFDDEGHGFTKRSNQLRAFRLTADWLERHLAA